MADALDGNDLDGHVPVALAVVFRGDQHRGQPRPDGRGDLFRYAAHRQYPPLDRYFAGHGQIPPHRQAVEGGVGRHRHSDSRRGAVHRRTAGKVDVNVVVRHLLAHHAQQGHGAAGGSQGHGGAPQGMAPLLAQFLGLHDAGDLHLPLAGWGGTGNCLQFHEGALVGAVDRQAVDPARLRRPDPAGFQAGGVVAALDHPFQVLPGDEAASLAMGQPGGHLYHVHRVPAAG